MRSLLYTAIFCVLTSLGCNQNKGNKLSEASKIRQEADKAGSGDHAFVQAATLQVSEPAAVYFHPDSIKLQNLEESLGEKFFTDAEESMGNLSTSRDHMIKENIRIIETEARELNFVKSDGSVKTIDVSSPEYTWGLFFFNGTDDPIQVDMERPEKQTAAYMKK